MFVVSSTSSFLRKIWFASPFCGEKKTFPLFFFCLVVLTQRREQYVAPRSGMVESEKGSYSFTSQFRFLYRFFFLREQKHFESRLSQLFPFKLLVPCLVLFLSWHCRTHLRTLNPYFLMFTNGLLFSTCAQFQVRRAPALTSCWENEKEKKRKKKQNKTKGTSTAAYETWKAAI